MITEFDGLMDRLGRMRFEFHQVQLDRPGRAVLAAVREWDGVADVVIMFDERRAVAFRTPARLGADIFDPVHVLWSYASNPVWTLRALITLAEPGDRDAPTALVEADGIGLPASRRASASALVRGRR